jgi:hypothetical protein
VAWIAKDQHVLQFLLNSLSPDILSHVLGMNTTAEAWKAINAMFKTASRTKAQQLREKLNDTKKLTMIADQYFTKMKGFSSELSALGKPIEEEELLGYLLHGLDKTEYNALITSVHGNPNTTLDEFYEQLCGYDMRNGVSGGDGKISLSVFFPSAVGTKDPREESPATGQQETAATMSTLALMAKTRGRL